MELLNPAFVEESVSLLVLVLTHGVVDVVIATDPDLLISFLERVRVMGWTIVSLWSHVDAEHIAISHDWGTCGFSCLSVIHLCEGVDLAWQELSQSLLGIRESGLERAVLPESRKVLRWGFRVVSASPSACCAGNDPFVDT